jgi:hypothetical protein
MKKPPTMTELRGFAEKTGQELIYSRLMGVVQELRIHINNQSDTLRVSIPRGSLIRIMEEVKASALDVMRPQVRLEEKARLAALSNHDLAQEALGEGSDLIRELATRLNNTTALLAREWERRDR